MTDSDISADYSPTVARRLTEEEKVQTRWSVSERTWMSVMTPRREASLYREETAAFLEMFLSPRNVYFGYLVHEARVRGLVRLGSIRRCFSPKDGPGSYQTAQNVMGRHQDLPESESTK